MGTTGLGQRPHHVEWGRAIAAAGFGLWVACIHTNHFSDSWVWGAFLGRCAAWGLHGLTAVASHELVPAAPNRHLCQAYRG